MQNRLPIRSYPNPVPWLLVLGLTLALLAGLTSAGRAQNADELRGDVPSAAAVTRQLSDLDQQRASLEQSLARSQSELSAALEERERLGQDLSQLASDIEELRGMWRQLAVNTFVSGGPNAAMRFLLESEGPPELSRRMQIIDTSTEPFDETTARLIDLESRAGAGLLALVGRSEALRAQIKEIRRALEVTAEAEVEARALLVIAEAWDRADQAIAESRYGFAATDDWEALRFCESTDNYRAISPSGRYRGAYQFDRNTWQTVGGVGDPAEAAPQEQDARARELYAKRGPDPWPVCGRFVR